MTQKMHINRDEIKAALQEYIRREILSPVWDLLDWTWDDNQTEVIATVSDARHYGNDDESRDPEYTENDEADEGEPFYVE
jgi:hypothetical protein